MLSLKGREISNNINLAQKVVKGNSRKNRGANVIFTLDMEKAYDRFEWDFLTLLFKFGFDPHFISLVNVILNTNFSLS